MKKNKVLHNRGLSLISFVLFVVFLLSSCNEEGPQFREFTYPVPTVTAISTDNSFPGEVITITGSNFGEAAGAIKLYFSGKVTSVANFVSVTDNEIKGKVPTDATSGDISMSVWTNDIGVIGTITVYKQPIITSVVSKGSVSTIIAQPGEEVWISGENFLTDPAKVAVDFNGTSAPDVISITSTLIKVKAPSGYTAGNINVTFKSSYTVNGSSLAPALNPGDVSTIFLRNYMQPFTTNNMLPEQKFTGTNWATPDYWTINSAAQNQINSGATVRCGGANYGKPNMANKGELSLQAGWGDATANVVTNGKMYQTAVLPAGSYKLEIEVMESGFNSYLTSSAVYLLAVSGNTVPDLISPDTAPTALASTAINNSVAYGNTVKQSITFTLATSTEVSMGFVATLKANSYLRMNYMKLYLLP